MSRRLRVLPNWGDLHAVEHPPLMMKQVFHAVCGGVRWQEAKQLGIKIATNAVDEQFVSASKQTRRALGLKPLKNKTASKKKLSSSSAAKVVANKEMVEAEQQEHTASALVVSKPQRPVTYDVLDATLGGGNHSGAVLENGSPWTRVVALDCDYAVKTTALSLAETFGSDRFRFYGNRMSEIRSMFGENSFDAVMLDGGPTVTQLLDPRRGFDLDSEDDHPMDMRYGPQMKLSALKYLNSCSPSELSTALRRYELLTPEQSAKLARGVCSRRPFTGCHSVLRALMSCSDAIPDQSWFDRRATARRKTSMSLNFLQSVRGIVNNEWFEFRAAFDAALLVLKPHGRLVVCTRYQWEERQLQDAIRHHPHALLISRDRISAEDAASTGHSVHSTVWAVVKTAKASFEMKNVQITEEEVKESATLWTVGAVGNQTFGFPAENFRFRDLDGKEKKIAARQAQPVPFDEDSEHFVFGSARKQHEH